jgi:DNA-binding MarR family transcriptional regulator
MRYLFRHPWAQPSQVAFGTGLQRSNLSTVLRGLEEKGLVDYVADAEDASSVDIHPTPRAHRNYKLVCREWATAVSAAAEGEGSVPATLPLLRKVADGLVHPRQAESRH